MRPDQPKGKRSSKDNDSYNDLESTNEQEVSKKGKAKSKGPPTQRSKSSSEQRRQSHNVAGPVPHVIDDSSDSDFAEDVPVKSKTKKTAPRVSLTPTTSALEADVKATLAMVSEIAKSQTRLASTVRSELACWSCLQVDDIDFRWKSWNIDRNSCPALSSQCSTSTSKS